MIEITIEVEGFPPAKNEALSMFGAGHTHAARVRRLLEAAQTATGTEFKPFTGPVGLEVSLWAVAGQAPWDATNYLGGIADVLQDKGRVGTSLDHLGDLAKVALYRNDRQIRDVQYHQDEDGESVGYRVRVWPLAGS